MIRSHIIIIITTTTIFIFILADIKLSDSQINQIVNFVGKFKKSEITRIGGRVFFEKNSFIANAIILITLVSGEVYEVSIVGDYEFF